jgi:hypothetical protein
VKYDKATLSEISASAHPVENLDSKVTVQFNPGSLKLSMTNSIDAGLSRGRQVQQYKGTSSTTLALDLVFDSADEGSTDSPIDVRTKTKQVIKFVLPGGSDHKKSPPRVRFHWGTFIFDGVMSQATEDLDLFAPDGTPLRAKVAISIKEQDPKFEDLKSGPGAKAGTDDPTGAASNPSSDDPAVPPGAPGSRGGGPTDKSAAAIGGESLADFAARNGLDPAAWRGLTAGVDNALSLSAGLDIPFNSGLNASAGLGLGIGVSAGVGLSLGVEASLGLEADVSLGVSATATAGFALSAAGGVTAALQTASIVRTEGAATQSRAAFGAPAAGSGRARTRGAGSLAEAAARAVAAGQLPGTVSAAAQARPPLARTVPVGASIQAGGIAAGGASATPAQSLRPVADDRATTYGFGIPLRPRVTGSADDRPGASTWIRIGPRPRAPEPLAVVDPTAPPWVALPAATSTTLASAPVHGGGPRRGCGCGCGGTR